MTTLEGNLDHAIKDPLLRKERVFYCKLPDENGYPIYAREVISTEQERVRGKRVCTSDEQRR
jgi:hypothetical protein